MGQYCSLIKDDERGKKETGFNQDKSNCSIHGIGYIFDRELGIFDRVIWLLVVVALLAVAAKITEDV